MKVEKEFSLSKYSGILVKNVFLKLKFILKFFVKIVFNIAIYKL